MERLENKSAGLWGIATVFVALMALASLFN